MSLKPYESQCRQYHEAYNRLALSPVPFSFEKLYPWEQFIFKKYTIEDLTDVMNMLFKVVRSGKKHAACMNFANLIGKIWNFEDALQTVRSEQALKRKPRIDPNKEQVMAQTGRKPAEPDTAKKANTIMEGMKLAQQLSEWKKANL